MVVPRKIDPAELQEGLADLNTLSEEEYGLNIPALLEDPSLPMAARQRRLGRLVGVLVKEPFAESGPMDPAQSHTGARRQWLLVEKSFRDPGKRTTWQYQVLDDLRKEPWIPGARGNSFNSPLALARDAYHEQGFLWYLARSCHAYICGNPQVMKKLEKAARRAGAGKTAQFLSPQGFPSGAGAAFATGLVESVPWLGLASAPMIAGIVLLIGTVGITAFCDWTMTQLEEPDQAEHER